MWLIRFVVVLFAVGFTTLLLSIEEAWKRHNSTQLAAALLGTLLVGWELVWWIFTGRL